MPVAVILGLVAIVLMIRRKDPDPYVLHYDRRVKRKWWEGE